MKRWTGFFLAAGIATGANAQSSITLYGTVDNGVNYVSNVGGARKYFTSAGIGQPDRLGLRGEEYLGDGMRAIFQLENGFNTTTGSLINSGVLWNREAYVGLASSTYGVLTLGHQTDFLQDFALRYSNGFFQHNLYAYHPGNLDNLANSSQVDNSVKYITNDYRGFMAGAMYGFSGGATSLGRTLGGFARYQNGPLSVAAMYVSINGRTFDFSSRMGFNSLFGQNGLTSTNVFRSEAVNNTAIGASYRFSQQWNVHALYTRSEVKAAGGSGNMFNYDTGVEYQNTVANALTLGYSYSAFNHVHWNQLEAGDMYSLSKATQLQAQVTYQQASGNGVADIYTVGPASGHEQLLVRVGMYHLF
ncbi:porin [Paraburkholderia sediminicola]|uniref:porin n=1 Tax=Paraburkholderia sediminicola TaxID=458836 RepID=UPI0038B94AAD